MKFEFDIKNSNIKRRIEQFEKHKKTGIIRINDKRFIEFENGIAKKYKFDSLKGIDNIKNAFCSLKEGKLFIEIKNKKKYVPGGIAYLIDYLIVNNNNNNNNEYISGNAKYEKILKIIDNALKLNISKKISNETRMLFFAFEKTNIFFQYFENKIIIAEFESKAKFSYVKNKIKRLLK